MFSFTTGSPRPSRDCHIGPTLLSAVVSMVSMSIVLSLASSDPLRAQRNTFDPSLGLRYVFRSNVDYAPIDEESDSSLRLVVNLPLIRDLKKGSLRFSYTGYTEYFDQREDLDNIGHRLNFGVSTQPSRRSSLNFSIGYSRTQDQGGPNYGIVEETEDPTFNRVAQRDRLAARLSYTYQLSQRWYGGVSLGASGWAFDDVEDSPTPEVSRDRWEAMLAARIGRNVSPSMRVGLVASFSQFDLDLGGITDSVAAALEVQKEIADDVNWTLRVGGFRNETEDAVEGIQDSSRTGWLAAFNLNKSLRRVALSFLASHGPAAGGYRLGTSVTSTVYVSIVDTHFRRWTWAVFARAGQRDPDIELEPTLKAYEAGFGIQMAVARFLGLSTGGSWVTQDDEIKDGSYSFYRLTAGLTWHPLGRKKISSWTSF